ncbi:MAG: phage tail protein [Campylobacteraceae bacterium]|jgi:hypothetical protein|nr:phage tail protein [Campylobacteraceae bacterium]
MNDYFLILTGIGKKKVAEAIINNTKVNIANVAFGDGNGNVVTPNISWTTLKKETWRTAPNSVDIHKDNNNWISVKAYVPKNIGGWFIREIGLFDNDNNLIAVGNYPDTYKPTLSLGVGVDMFIEVIMEVSDAAAITLQVDPSQILVTKEQMEEYVKENSGNRDNIGTLEFSARQDVPFGRLRCDGTIYNADTSTEFANFYDNYLLTGKFRTITFLAYEKLVYLERSGTNQGGLTTTTYTEVGECGYFGIDTATRRFRVPKIKNGSALTQAENITELGEWYDGAIQNITGSFSTDDSVVGTGDHYAKHPPKGAFYKGEKYYGFDFVNASGYTGATLEFDASRVVSTAEETRNRQIRYPIFVTITNSTNSVPITDNIWNDFLSNLNNKANIDLSNVSNNIDYVVETYKNATSWYRKYKSGWIEQSAEISTGIGGNSEAVITVPYLMPFTSVDNTVILQPITKTAAETWNSVDNVTNKTTTNFQVLVRAYSKIAYMAYGF